MALNENVIKNIANEVARNCQARSVVEPDFVVFLVDLLLLDPRYGKRFAKTVNRKNLQFLVDQCIEIVTREDTSLNTLKMQYIMETNYDTLQNLVDKNIESIANCLKPLVAEIVEEEPAADDEAGSRKLFRKLSIYIVLASGLGNPGVITTLKEGMAALESVFSMHDLRLFVTVPRDEKLARLNELVEIVSGVRLFNRDCKKGGDGIPDLPFSLVDASRACQASLSGTLVAVMQRVNALTTAIEGAVCVQEETGNVYVEAVDSDLTVDACTELVHLLAYYRQYEVYTRRLLADVEAMGADAAALVEAAKGALQKLHAATQYKEAVPVTTVYPLFSELWRVWKSMQNVMYLVATVNRLASALAAVQDLVRIPHSTLDRLLKGRQVVSDQERMTAAITIEQRLSMGALKNYVSSSASGTSITDKNIQFLGFCALCLSVGALIPSNMKVGLIKSKGHMYGFCTAAMATRFSKDPDRYTNEVLEYARKNPHMINLLGVSQEVYKVKDVDVLVTKYTPKTKVQDKDIQTEVHPVDSYIEKNYTWDTWELKRRACQWATIVNCRTHSTQTHASHMRSETHSQTVERRDKEMQTKRDAAVGAAAGAHCLWGLRGRLGYGQHKVDFGHETAPEKKKGI